MDFKAGSQESFELIEIDSMCRLCGNVNDQLIPIFTDEGAENELPSKLSQYLPVMKINEMDELPKKICVQCTNSVLVWHDFVLCCMEADKKLAKLIAMSDMYQQQKRTKDLRPKITQTDTSNMQTVRKIQYLVDNEDAEHFHNDDIEEDSQDVIKIKETYAESEVDDERPQCSKTEIFETVENGSDFSPMVETRCSSRASSNVKIEIVDDENATNVVYYVRADESGMSPEPEVPVFECDQCGKRLRTRTTLLQHCQIHTGEKPHVCRFCDKCFRHPSTLYRHVRDTHSQTKDFPCDICGRMFSNRRNVAEHRYLHTGEKTYVCDTCGRAFKQKAALFMHKKSHDAVYKFECNECHLKFRSKSSLLVHVSRHTGEKKYECDLCDKKFRVEYYLKKHQLVHGKQKAFACVDCGAEFRQKRYISHHYKTKHPELMDKLTTKDGLDAVAIPINDKME